MKVIYKIDNNGFLLFGEEKEIGVNEELPVGYIDVPLPSDSDGQMPFYRPKWTGTEWNENMSQEEIDELNNSPKEPTTEERLQMAEETILFLMDMNLMGGM